MKITRVLLVAAAIAVSACSKDNDAKSSSLENASLSLSSKTVVTAPSGLASSDDSYAQMANGWIQMANAMSSYTAYMKAPAGATKSSTRLTATNGRVKANGDFVAWTWSDSQSGYTVGYQISEDGDSYVFEVFIKMPGSDSFLKYFHAEEKKDKSSGSMEIYDIFDQDPTKVIVTYDWSTSGDNFTFTMSGADGDTSFNFVLTENTKTKAGNIVYNINEKKEFEMEWASNGSGSWTEYDSDGTTVLDSGTWS